MSSFVHTFSTTLNAKPKLSNTSDITVLYVHCITDNDAPLKHIKTIAKLCGNRVANLVIVTTKWEEGTEHKKKAEEQRLQSYLAENKLNMVVSRLERFDESPNSAKRILMDAVNRSPYVSFPHCLIFKKDADGNSPSAPNAKNECVSTFPFEFEVNRNIILAFLKAMMKVTDAVVCSNSSVLLETALVHLPSPLSWHDQIRILILFGSMHFNYTLPSQSDKVIIRGLQGQTPILDVFPNLTTGKLTIFSCFGGRTVETA